VKTSLFYLPSVGRRADIEAGMAGLRGDLYGQMLVEISEQARLADDLGYDSINFTEHQERIQDFTQRTLFDSTTCPLQRSRYDSTPSS